MKACRSPLLLTASQQQQSQQQQQVGQLVYLHLVRVPFRLLGSSRSVCHAAAGCLKMHSSSSSSRRRGTGDNSSSGMLALLMLHRQHMGASA
jgi:hypothetical protein